MDQHGAQIGRGQDRFGHLAVVNLAVADDHRAVDAPGQAHVVGNDDEGFALRYQPLEQAEDGLGGLRIQVAGGFVRHDEGRVVCQGPGDGRPLLLAPRNRRRQLRGVSGDADQVEQV